MNDERAPDFVSVIVFLDANAFADGESITADTIGVVLSTAQGKFQAMIDLRSVKPVFAKNNYSVPVFLIDTEYASVFFKPGQKFDIVSSRVIGEGTVVPNNQH